MSDKDQSSVVEATFLEDPPTSDVDNSAKAEALSRLFGAYGRLDMKQVAEDNELTVAQLSQVLPPTYANHLANDMMMTLLGVDSIGHFVINAIESISSLANAIVGLTSGIDPALITKLTKRMAEYTDAPAGSVAEVLADQRIQEIIADINAAALATNNHLVAGFADEDSGFVISASDVLATSFFDDDSEEETEEADSETVHPAYDS